MVSHYSTVVRLAYDSLVPFCDAYSQKYLDKLAENLELRWKALLDGFVKVNWDAVVDKNKMKMGTGVIIRDSIGEVLATLSEPKDYIIAFEVAEATTALRATKRLRHWGFYKVILECDSLQIV
jgi:hypothetical protein